MLRNVFDYTNPLHNNYLARNTLVALYTEFFESNYRFFVHDWDNHQNDPIHSEGYHGYCQIKWGLLFPVERLDRLNSI